MGPGVYLVAIGLLTLLLLASALIFLWIVRKLFGALRGPFFTWLAVLSPLAAGGVFVGLLAWMYIGPSIQSGDAAFREIFDELPPSGVTIIQHEAQGGTDFGEAAVEFRTDNNATLQSLLTKVQARPVERKDLGISIDDLPNWWSARDCPDAQLFKATNVRGWQEIDIANCPRTKVTDAIARWIQ